ncbi:DUF975 family protein [Bifidobacterium sp. 64T4]|uniref:DUF975 family protein n=1 Tax=Bifidobacterium pongonis TaxID=2834432 RepID=UPI001C58640D|nr:DUF975 family protein [Bifidobacterium pongonis]MBW3095089.1 DUF975 family protein [Bifidobacterium pongonis]
MNRKFLKAQARVTLKRHYWLIVALCLFAAFLGAEYGSTLWATDYQAPSETVSTTVDGTGSDGSIATSSAASDHLSTNGISDIFDMLVSGNEDAAKQQVKQSEKNIRDNDNNAMLGRSRGVFAMVLNSFSTGGAILSITDAANSIIHSRGVVTALLVLAGLAFYLFVWLFIRQTYLVASRRMVLESRVYEQVPVHHLLFPVRTRKWAHIAWTMFVQSVFLTLWWCTIIGGIIKTFSYLLVPFILAENPSMKACDAITLSRRMMKGHKWECFVAMLSFLGWDILSSLTFGIVGVFYVNGYKAAFWAEYYTYVRGVSKQASVEGTDQLNDTFLFEKAPSELLETTYADARKVIDEVDAQGETISKPKGFAGWLADWFGIRIMRSKAVAAWEDYRAKMNAVKTGRALLDARMYPVRLSPIPMKDKNINVGGLNAARSYSALNLVMMFFIFCIIGWLWEVALCLIDEGIFVNRGTLHGPWLPIYGTGGIIILILLKKLREHPVAEFVAAIVLCGGLEYLSSWYLETTKGQRWWDYTGYFLNLNGRICAEGLLVFGLGGLAIVYLVAPTLNQLLDRINRKALFCVALVLLIAYIGDQVYSNQHPNSGHGITDTGTSSVQVGS